MRPLLVFLIIILICTSKQTNATTDHYDYIDTLPLKRVKGVVYNKETRQYDVTFTDGSKESMGRDSLDKRGIYFPGNLEKKDTATSIPMKAGEIEASVDRALWEQHIDAKLGDFLHYATKKGMRRGSYKVMVRFLVIKDGSLSDISVKNDPGYGFTEFIEQTLKTGPKWSPAEKNGKRLRSYHTQPISFEIKTHDFY